MGQTMHDLLVATMRGFAAATLATLTLAVAPASALDLGGSLRGGVETTDADAWKALATTEVETAADPEDALDTIIREDAGRTDEPAEPRESVRALTPEELTQVRSADPATAALNLFGPARAPDYVPVVPRQTSSIAVLPQQSWGLGQSRRSSLQSLGGF